jgi:hypothetical protein
VLWPKKGQDEEGELCNVGVATECSAPPVCFHSMDIENFTSSLSFDYSSI